MRTVILGLIALGLAVAVFLIWPRGADEEPSGTAQVTTSTITGDTPGSTTTSVPVTSTVTDDSHVVETVEEAEEILRELWFGWFEGIYNQDEDRIREVVATEHQLDLARSQFGAMEFQAQPIADDLVYIETEILRADDQCTVVWTTAVISGFAQGETSDVHVLRWLNGWRFFSLWTHPNDLWEDDCDASLS